MPPFEKDNKVTADMCWGVAPGMPNCRVGYHNERMIPDEVGFRVGGLPKIRTLPFE
jgi:hypothetical protein